MKKIAYYVVPVLLCLIAGLVAGRLQAESVAVWYPLLAKPALTPPDIAFPIAWGIIYLCMGLSLGRVLRYGDKRYVTLWFLQLAVNFLWSVFFFYLRSPLAGFVDILLLDALVIVYIAGCGTGLLRRRGFLHPTCCGSSSRPTSTDISS